MKQKILAAFCLLLFAFGAYATHVSPDRAAVVGLNFWKSQAALINGLNVEQSEVVNTYTVSENGQPLYYIFNISPKGFVIVTAEDAVIPVIGYSFEGFYKPDDQPEAFRYWMNSYKLQIREARQKKLSADKKAASAWKYYSDDNFRKPDLSGVKGVAPLCTTLWNQGNGYNYMCPLHPDGPGGRCYAGCVATAMAQIMKYWNYPAQGVGSHSYYHPYYGLISADFGATTYNWSLMTNSLNSGNMVDIATLIFDCGVAVDMDYSPIGSGASSSLVPDAFKNYFHYRLTTTLINRSDYMLPDWRNVIMDNLDDGKPVYYSGSGSAGGHAWVCDGYQDTSNFHMNWGWSGYNNGYFALDNLNSGNGDFSSGEQAVVNIAPYDAPYCHKGKVLRDRIRDFNDGSDYSYYWNNTDCDWLIQPDNAVKIVLTFTDFRTEAGKDIVNVYDGSSADAPLLGTYSGHITPPVLTSSGGTMFITFTSDSINQDLGWEANYIAYLAAGTDSYDLTSSTLIYPNPVHSILKIQSKRGFPEDLSYKILNMTGQLIQTGHIGKGLQEYELDVTALPRGIYTLLLSSESSCYFSKVVVQ